MKRHDSSENEVKEYLAEFYNNLGAHLVGLGDYEYGLKYFEEAMSVLCEKFDNSKNKDGKESVAALRRKLQRRCVRTYRRLQQSRRDG